MINIIRKCFINSFFFVLKALTHSEKWGRGAFRACDVTSEHVSLLSSNDFQSFPHFSGAWVHLLLTLTSTLTSRASTRN